MGRSALLGCLVSGEKRAEIAIDIIPQIKAERGRATLAYLCRTHPRPVELHTLLIASGLQGTGHAMGALEYWLSRIEDDLPLVGWRLVRNGGGNGNNISLMKAR